MQRRHIATSQMGDAVVPTPQSQATCRAPCNHSLGSLIRVSLSVPKGQAKTGTSRQTTHPAASATPPDRRDSRRGRELNVEILRTEERSVGRPAERGATRRRRAVGLWGHTPKEEKKRFLPIGSFRGGGSGGKGRNLGRAVTFIALLLLGRREGTKGRASPCGQRTKGTEYGQIGRWTGGMKRRQSAVVARLA